MARNKMNLINIFYALLSQQNYNQRNTSVMLSINLTDIILTGYHKYVQTCQAFYRHLIINLTLANYYLINTVCPNPAVNEANRTILASS